MRPTAYFAALTGMQSHLQWATLTLDCIAKCSSNHIINFADDRSVVDMSDESAVREAMEWSHVKQFHY